MFNLWVQFFVYGYKRHEDKFVFSRSSYYIASVNHQILLTFFDCMSQFVLLQ